jgi:hypothetical protein
MSRKPMNSMLERQTKEEALKKRSERSKMVIKDVPPTTPGIFNVIWYFMVCSNLYKMKSNTVIATFSVSQVLAQRKQAKKKTKAAPYCRVCKKPMKGHKYVEGCPKNAVIE